MTYLEMDNPRVVETIDNIIGEIVSHFHPRSIILTGGFGRNEASVIDDGGELEFLSDFEVLMASRWPISRRAIKELAAELSRKSGMEIVLQDSIRFRLYSWTCIPAVLLSKLWRPSIAFYELKHGSRIAFGENILKRLPDIGPQDIPLWEGIRLMLNRMAGALECVALDEHERDKSIYWINKVLFACQDALLLSLKQYHYSYRERNSIFRESFPRHFKELHNRLPHFLPLVSKATDHKLKPARDNYSQQVTRLWFDTAEICDAVFKYVIEKDMGITFDNHLEFQESYLKHPKIKGQYYHLFLF